MASSPDSDSDDGLLITTTTNHPSLHTRASARSIRTAASSYTRHGSESADIALTTIPRRQSVPKLHTESGHTQSPSPTTAPYWSKAPVWGVLPSHHLQSNSTVLVDSMAWIFGGGDREKGSYNDVWCFCTGE